MNSSLCRKGLLLALIIIGVVAAPAASEAGLMDFAKRASAWWHAHSIGVSVKDQDVQVDGGDSKDVGSDPSRKDNPQGDATGTGGSAGNAGAGADPGGKDNPGNDKEPTPGKAVPGMCIVPQEQPVTKCDIGSGFLCVSTPKGGVAGGAIFIKGTIDRNSSVLASINIAAQNEYTKKMSSVDTARPDESDCWDESRKGKAFCLDTEGRYSALVALPDFGPYTITVSASRLTGESIEQSVRTSRVKPFKLDDKSLAMEPDIRTKSDVDTTHVFVTAKLLGDCQFCDFIGASTGGINVSVENVIKDSSGSERRISCQTTVEQGGQGTFVVGVPVGEGQNTVSVKACNAATEASACPGVEGLSFTGKQSASETAEGISISSPPPQPSYDSQEYPTIQWKFTAKGTSACLYARVNRESAVKLCPDGQGVYSMTIKPRVGINIASLSGDAGAEQFSWTFGWGRILSPFVKGAGQISVPSAAEIALPANTANGMLVPLINNFMGSDERGKLIKQLFSVDGAGAQPEAAPSDNIKALIPGCGSDEGLGGFSTALRDTPTIDSAELSELAFGDSRADVSLMLTGMNINMNLVPTKDLPSLPLVISFRKAKLDLSLLSSKAQDGTPIIVIGSQHDDCEFKSSVYCQHRPSALVPANIIGGANEWGSFIRCDMALAAGKAVDACGAINTLNAQTGVVSEKVLDAINNAIYCGGSAALTRLAQIGAQMSPIKLGCAAEGECSGITRILPQIEIPIGVDLKGGLGISSGGLLVDAGISAGSEKSFGTIPEAMKIPSAGIIAGTGFGERSFISAQDAGGQLGLALSLDAVNALLYAASAQGDGQSSRGLLDYDVWEGFFTDLGFDFVKKCDEFKTTVESPNKDTLCNLRPRVSELLGSALTTYGYFEGNDPLLVAVRGNRALGLRIAATTIDDMPVVKKEEGGSSTPESGSSYTPAGSLISMELGGVTLAFYALEADRSQLDEYGNPKIKLDSKGKPTIRSMRPQESDKWKGQIVDFDLSLLLAVEIGSLTIDPTDDTKFYIPLNVLADRSRLVLTPVGGSNSTTVPSAGLVSALSEKLKLGISAFSGKDKNSSIKIPVPREMAFELGADDGSIFSTLGLAKISVNKDGLSIDFDPQRNSAIASLSAVISQLLHKNGQETKYTIPK